MSGWLSQRLVERGIIKEEEQEIYQFGIRNGMIILLNVLTAFLIGLITEKLFIVAVFTVSFMVLRSYTGGYHSDSRVFCYIGSNLVLFIPVYTEMLFVKTENFVLGIFLAIAVSIIMIFSPMHSKNRKLDQAEQKHFGRRARVITVVQLIILGILWYGGVTSYTYAIYSSICITAVFMLIGKEIHWDANVWYMERLHLQPERLDPSNPAQSISFAEVTHKGNRHLLQMYIKYGIGITNLAISNLRSEQVYIRGFLEDLNQSETENVCMVTSQQMDEYFRAEQLREVKEETYNKKVMCILHFFNYLKVKGHIERIPFDPDYYIKKTFQQHHDRSVEQEVMDEIMANLYKFSEDTRLMFLHLWGIGLRLSEVCTLKGNAYYMQGHDAWIQVYQIKMRTYKRIPIPMALYKLMKVYIAKYNRKADEYIFQNQKGGAYHKGTFKNKMIKACKECNVQNGEYIFRSHDYRHTIATAFYDTGVPIQSIRDYLGHDYEEMTRQYVDFMPKKIEKANEEYFKKGSLASCLRKGVNDNGE